MHNPPQRSAVTAFAAEPTSATAARRFVRQTLTSAGITQPVRDRAELIVSELVTNAVLHAGAGPVVSVRIDENHVHIEVEDTSSSAPVLREYGLDASTGRGLQVVSKAANEWGVATTPSGKAVWANLFTNVDSTTTPLAPLAAPVLSYKPARNIDEPGPLDELAREATSLCIFEDIPVALYLELESHNESLVREFSLLAIQVNSEERKQMPAALRDAVVISTTIDVRFSMLRVGAREALRRHDDMFSMELEMTRSAAAHLQRFETWSVLADELSDEKLLLTSAASPDVRALRTWLVHQTVAQIEHNATPTPWNATPAK